MHNVEKQCSYCMYAICNPCKRSLRTPCNIVCMLFGYTSILLCQQHSYLQFTNVLVCHFVVSKHDTFTSKQVHLGTAHPCTWLYGSSRKMKLHTFQLHVRAWLAKHIVMHRRRNTFKSKGAKHTPIIKIAYCAINKMASMSNLRISILKRTVGLHSSNKLIKEPQTAVSPLL